MSGLTGRGMHGAGKHVKEMRKVKKAFQAGEIDKRGHLWIVRADKTKAICCPWSCPDSHPDVLPGPVRCGDWCPLFGEPFETDELSWIVLDCGAGRILLSFENFTDKRGAFADDECY